MKTTLNCLGLIALAVSTAFGQTAFDVISIKPNDSGANGAQMGLSPGGTLNAKNVPLKALIQQAYDVRDFQVFGGPGWLDTQKYDIIAKSGTAEGAGVSEDDVRKMTDAQRNTLKEQLVAKVRALLADRFQLKIHRETKEMPVYALIVAKNGAKIEVAKDSDLTHSGLSVRRDETGKSAVTATGIALPFLVKFLSNQVGKPVLDRTGLKGNYDFKMTFTPDLNAAESDGPSIFTAVQEQLGLKLDSQKGPVEVVVIDSVQKASEN